MANSREVDDAGQTPLVTVTNPKLRAWEEARRKRQARKQGTETPEAVSSFNAQVAAQSPQSSRRQTNNAARDAKAGTTAQRQGETPTTRPSMAEQRTTGRDLEDVDPWNRPNFQDREAEQPQTFARQTQNPRAPGRQPVAGRTTQGQPQQTVRLGPDGQDQLRPQEQQRTGQHPTVGDNRNSPQLSEVPGIQNAAELANTRALIEDARRQKAVMDNMVLPAQEGDHDLLMAKQKATYRELKNERTELQEAGQEELVPEIAYVEDTTKRDLAQEQDRQSKEDQDRALLNAYEAELRDDPQLLPETAQVIAQLNSVDTPQERNAATRAAERLRNRLLTDVEKNHKNDSNIRLKVEYALEHGATPERLKQIGLTEIEMRRYDAVVTADMNAREFSGQSRREAELAREPDPLERGFERGLEMGLQMNMFQPPTG